MRYAFVLHTDAQCVTAVPYYQSLAQPQSFPSPPAPSPVAQFAATRHHIDPKISSSITRQYSYVPV